MNWIAFRMLTGNRGKYLAIIFGVAFATLLIAQQSSIFCGLMLLTTSQIRDIQGANIWVMDPNVQFVDDIKPLSDTDLFRVRGVRGVAWAERLYKGLSRARLRDGQFQQVILIGVDDATLVGAPQVMLRGDIEDLRRPDAVIVDQRGFQRLWPGEPLAVGKTIEMNDHRALLVGICTASRTFQTFPVVYTLYGSATGFVPPERKVMSFVLAQNQQETDASQVCRQIETQTGLKALTQEQFKWQTIDYYLNNTGIPVNFGITVALGFIVGAAVAGQTFYLFTIENLRQFGVLKALGTSNARIVRMMLVQAVFVSFVGYGLGIGMAALFGMLAGNTSRLAFFMPWQIPLGTAVAVFAMVIGTSLLSIRRVLSLEPASVFQG